MTDTREATCAERIEGNLASRTEDLTSLYTRLEALGYDADDDDERDEIEDEINNFALAAQIKSTLVVTIGTGGPGDQFEIEVERGQHGWELADNEATYRFLDWFDGATTTTRDENVMRYLANIIECME